MTRKNIQKKALKIILTIICCLLIINIFTRFVLRKYYRTTARHFASLEYIKKVKTQTHIDYLIVGDSTGMHSVNPKFISNDTYSVCISGASLLDTYRLLSEFDLSRIKKGIILTNSFNSELHYGEDFWRRFILTNSYSLIELVEIYNESKTRNIFPANQFSAGEFYSISIATKLLLNKYAFEALSEYLRSFKWNKNYFHKYLSFFNENNGYVTLEDPGSGFELKDEDFFHPYSDFYNKNFLIDQTDFYYLNKIYQLTSRANLWLIMPFLPLADQASRVNLSAFKNSFKSYFSHYELLHPYYLFTPIKIELNRSEFFDFNHVNSKGAIKTTKALLNTLNTHKF